MATGGSPRDKMIGMMYLVLTALLAMNVSKDILNSFIVVNDGLSKTNQGFENKNADTYTQFSKLSEKDAKAKPYYDRAQQVQKLSKEMRDYIFEIKKKLLMVIDKKDDTAAVRILKTNMYEIDSKDNYDEPTRLLGLGEPTNPAKEPVQANGPNTAFQLKTKIDETREKFLKLIADGNGVKLLATEKTALEKSIKTILNTDVKRIDNGVEEDWSAINFYHIPLVAAITNLTKMESDINNAEADMVKTLIGAVGANDVKFDQFEARVLAGTTYVLQGEEFKADVILAASSSTQKNKMIVGNVDTVKKELIGNGTELEVVRGLGKYAVKTTGEGLQKWGGIIEVNKPDGTVEKYPFQHEYIVARPAAATFLKKMNVFYIGVDNPILISAAGIAETNLQYTITGGGGTIKKGKDEEGKDCWIARVTTPTQKPNFVTITVSDKTSKKVLGTFNFRAKSLPTPMSVLGGKSGTFEMKRSLLSVLSGVTAKMENFDFEFPIKIVSFKYENYNSNGGTYQSETNDKGVAVMSSRMKDDISRLRANSKIYFTEIKALMPDGKTRTLPDIGVKIIL